MSRRSQASIWVCSVVTELCRPLAAVVSAPVFVAVKSLQEQIDGWDRRLATYRALLSRQFTAMETAIATLKSQTSSIASLVKATTSSSTSS